MKAKEKLIKSYEDSWRLGVEIIVKAEKNIKEILKKEGNWRDIKLSLQSIGIKNHWEILAIVHYLLRYDDMYKINTEKCKKCDSFEYGSCKMITYYNKKCIAEKGSYWKERKQKKSEHEDFLDWLADLMKWAETSEEKKLIIKAAAKECGLKI